MLKILLIILWYDYLFLLVWSLNISREEKKKLSFTRLNVFEKYIIMTAGKTKSVLFSSLLVGCQGFLNLSVVKKLLEEVA